MRARRSPPAFHSRPSADGRLRHPLSARRSALTACALRSRARLRRCGRARSGARTDGLAGPSPCSTATSATQEPSASNVLSPSISGLRPRRSFKWQASRLDGGQGNRGRQARRARSRWCGTRSRGGGSGAEAAYLRGFVSRLRNKWGKKGRPMLRTSPRHWVLPFRRLTGPAPKLHIFFISEAGPFTSCSRRRTHAGGWLTFLR